LLEYWSADQSFVQKAKYVGLYDLKCRLQEEVLRLEQENVELAEKTNSVRSA
jgi:hypothetical protein